MPESIGRKVQLSGRVQGVFFRVWTKQQADRLGVRGWVRNRADGSVEAYFEGDARAVDQMVDAARDGPDGARVDGIEIEDVPANFTDRFEIRH